MKLNELFTTRAFTLSNFLSMLRVLLVPVIGHYIIRIPKEESARYYAVGIAAFMVMTDFFDGWLARRLGQETPLGQYLDPVADKIAILFIMWMIWYHLDYPLWLCVFVTAREVIGTYGGAYLLLKKNIMGTPNYWGKWGVTFIAYSGVHYMMGWPYREWTLVPVVFTLVGGIAAYAGTYWKSVFGSDREKPDAQG